MTQYKQNFESFYKFSSGEVSLFEHKFDIAIPSDYKKFLLNYGQCNIDTSINGLKYSYCVPALANIDFNFESEGLANYDEIIRDFQLPEDDNMIIKYKEKINYNKKRIIIGCDAGSWKFTISENGEVEFWRYNGDCGYDFLHIANSFTEFLNSLKPSEE